MFEYRKWVGILLFVLSAPLAACGRIDVRAPLR